MNHAYAGLRLTFWKPFTPFPLVHLQKSEKVIRLKPHARGKQRIQGRKCTPTKRVMLARVPCVPPSFRPASQGDQGNHFKAQGGEDAGTWNVLVERK